MTRFSLPVLRRGQVLLVLSALPALCLLLAWASTAAPALIDAQDLDSLSIYAYRDWQSTGVYVQPDQRVSVRARGEWLYTPGEWHDANGHRRYLAPKFYPVPGVRGGALIGKIGEQGGAFMVGADRMWRVGEAGMLYLRIDDDIVSDNEGKLQVDVRVVSP